MDAPPSPTAPITNIHGRKPGRGIRPWLLIPKVLCFATLLGGLIAALGIAMSARPDDPASAQQAARTIAVIVHWTIIPGGAGAFLFGLLLLLQHPAVFLRLRWLQLKLVLLPALILLHLYTRHLNKSLPDHPATPGNLTSLRGMLLAAVLLTALIIFLGRHKPRLTQNWAKDFPTPASSRRP
ncbi:MAG: hypothetical protein IT441_01060 [Phycisphaeraceae bacterium]|nr:hypothetical protein [Phycisphaeraceae bacterium]